MAHKTSPSALPQWLARVLEADLELGFEEGRIMSNRNDDYYLSDGETGFVAPHARLVWPNERRSLREKRVQAWPTATKNMSRSEKYSSPHAHVLDQWRHWAMTKAAYRLLQITTPC